MVIMGMGGLMFFMFIIMVVIWVSGQDDEGTGTGTESTTTGTGTATAGTGTATAGTGTATAGTGTATAGTGTATAGTGTATAGTGAAVSCPTGQKNVNGTCYPICNGGQITVNCNNALHSGAHFFEHYDVNHATHPGDCQNRFLKDSNSESGYYQCQWNNDHCNIMRGGSDFTLIECAPEDEHVCVEGVTWQEAGTESECLCPGSETDRSWHADNDGRWRCCNQSTGSENCKAATP